MNVVITGASKGIGEALAKRFHRDKDNNIFLISRNKIKLEKIKEDCSNRIHILPLDLSSSNDLREIQDYFIQGNTQINLLINNAGYLNNAPFSEQTEIEVKKQIEVNLLAPIVLTQSLLKSFTKGSQVLNISSMGGVQDSVKFPGLSIYSSAKGGLNTFTQSLAVELAEYGININALALGAVNTEMLNKAFPGYNAPVNPSQIADTIYNLYLNYTSFVTGKVIQLNQGTPI